MVVVRRRIWKVTILFLLEYCCCSNITCSAHLHLDVITELIDGMESRTDGRTDGRTARARVGQLDRSTAVFDG